MNAPDKKQILRDALLQIMDANRTRFGLTDMVLRDQLRFHAITPDKYGGQEPFAEELAGALEYLTKHSLVEDVEKVLNRHVRCWRLTQAGFEYVDANL